MTIKFQILGDPVPYLTRTSRTSRLLKIPRHKVRETHIKEWDKVRQYVDWLEYVGYCVLNARIKLPSFPKEKIYLNIMVFYPKKPHVIDPENIRKGIQDALFEEDKNVAGAYDYDYDANNPRCEVTIIQ